MLKVSQGKSKSWEDGSVQVQPATKAQSQQSKSSQPALQGKNAMSRLFGDKVRVIGAKKQKRNRTPSIMGHIEKLQRQPMEYAKPITKKSM